MTKLSNADEPNWGLFYREHRKDLDARKSIKVKLPIRQHIRLHALKLFTEKNISETVEKALDAYFENMKDEDEAAAGVIAAGGVTTDEPRNVGAGAPAGVVAGDTSEGARGTVTARDRV